MIFKQKDTELPSTTTNNTTHSGVGAGTLLMLLAVAALGAGGGVYALTPKAPPAPTAEEVIATLPSEEASIRMEYASLKKQGKSEVAEIYAKAKGLQVAMTGVEALHDETPTAEDKETHPEGNVQAPE